MPIHFGRFEKKLVLYFSSKTYNYKIDQNYLIEFYIASIRPHTPI